MKKFLLLFIVLAFTGVATGYAQQLDAPRDPLADWRAKTEAKRIEMAGQRDNAAAPAADPFAKMIIAKSEIKAVTVYNSRAKITRVAEIDVPEGAHTVAFTDLPETLLPDSLRAEGSAKAAVKIGAISNKRIMQSHLVSPHEQELTDKLQSLQDQRKPFELEKTALAAEEQFLNNIGQQATLRNNENLAQIDLKPEQWTLAAQAIHNSLSDVYKTRAVQDEKLRDLDLEYNKTQRELQQISTGARSIFAVMVPLEAEKATKLTLEISYQVPNATWLPIYDARSNTDGKGDLKLIQYGSVRQKTGEDWTGVALTLSTAQPQRGTSLPESQPMWIDAYEMRNEYANQSVVGAGMETRQTVGAAEADPAYMKKVQEQNRRLAADAAASGGSAMPVPVAEEEPKAIQFATATINTGGFVSEYKIPGPANVPSDGTETKLMVGTFDLESKLQVHIKPQMSEEAYLVVNSKLKGDAPILPGQVNLFRDEAYVGQSQLPLLRPGEEYNLYFGVDDQVAVKRKVLKDERKQAGVIAKDNILERNYVTELQNLHSAPIDIVVKETVPAPRNEKIRVEIAKDTTTPGYTEDTDNIKGLLDWKFKMEPKEKKDLKLDWTVSWPSDYTVSGL